MKAQAILMVVAAALLAGCGTDKDDELRAEQAKTLAELRQQVETLTEQVGQMRREIRRVDDDLFELKDQVEFALLSPRGSSTPAAAATGPEVEAEATAGSTAGLDTPEAGASAQPIEADIEIVAAELTKMRDTLDELRAEYTADKELAELQDPRRTWEALNDPEELIQRIDRFAEMQAGEFEDAAVRDQFLADVEAYKQELVARAAMTTEEQIAAYRSRLTEQIGSDTTGRRGRWYQSQLDALNAGDEEAVTEALDRANRFENARELGELANKYDIARETMRDNGLAAFGGPGPGPGRPPGGRTRGR
jgi:hypothetical protein